MESITTVLEYPIFSKLIILILLLVIIGVYVKRVGSIHSLWARLWRLLVGSAEVKDPRLSKFIHETQELEGFSFIYGIRLATKAELYLFLSWLDRHSISIARAKKAGNWINVKTPGLIDQPPQDYVYKNRIKALLYFLVFVTGSAIAIFPYGFLEIKVSKTWFLVDTHSARNIGMSWKIDRSICESGVSEAMKVSNFSQADTEVICKLVQDKSFQSFAEKTLKGQQAIGLTIIIVAWLFLISVALRLTSAIEAKKIYTEINKEDVEAPDAN